MFLTTYLFKAEVSKISLTPFFATVSPEQYCFLVFPSDPCLYGCFIANEAADLLEYFTNEFPVKGLWMIPSMEFKRIRSAENYIVWGSKELLHSI